MVEDKPAYYKLDIWRVNDHTYKSTVCLLQIGNYK